MYVWVWLILPTLMVTIVLLFTTWRQQSVRKLMLSQQAAWERAQDGRLQKWRSYQDQRISQLEQQVLARLETIGTKQQTQPTRSIPPVVKRDQALLQIPPTPIVNRDQAPSQPISIPTVEHDQAFPSIAPTPTIKRDQAPSQPVSTLTANERIDALLAQVPRIEDVPLPARHASTEPTRPALHLPGADLSQRDLSYLYLRNADLRNAQLTRTNFFMADLSGANLSGACLRGADLSAANLTNANLANADLTGANLLVADLNHACLNGARLQQVRNLSSEQLRSIQNTDQQPARPHS